MFHTLLVLPYRTFCGLLKPRVGRALEFAIESGHKGAAAVVGILAARLQQTDIADGVT